MIVSVDVSNMRATIHAICAGAPNAATRAAFAGAMASAFQDTQDRVHVITDSLRQSGKLTVDEVVRGVLEGTIEYGGDSTGPIDPVVYAIYEMARGGDHDFFAGLPEFYPALQAATAVQLKT